MSDPEPETETLPGLTTQTVLGAAGVMLTQVVATVVADNLRSWNVGLIARRVRRLVDGSTVSAAVVADSNSADAVLDESILDFDPGGPIELGVAGPGRFWLVRSMGPAQQVVRRVAVVAARQHALKHAEDLHLPRDLSAELRRLVEGLLPGLWDVGEGSQGEFVIDLERRTIQRHFEHYLAARASRTQHTLPWGA